MTDDLKEIEEALTSYASAVFLEVGDGSDECIERTRLRREKLLALIRQKLPQTDAEHERAVEAWRKEATSDDSPTTDYLRASREMIYALRQGEIEDAVRLMRARPVRKEVADLLRAAKEASEWLRGINVYDGDPDAPDFADKSSQHDDDVQSRLLLAIEAAERAGLQP